MKIAFRAALLAAAFGAAFVAPVSSQQRPAAPPVQLAQADAKVKERVDLLFADIRKQGSKVEYGEAEAGVGPEGLVVKKIKITGSDGKTVAIEGIEIRAMDWANPKAARYADLTVAGVEVPLDQQSAGPGPSAKDLGYEKLNLDFHLAYKFDEAKKEFDIARLDIDIADFGDFSMTLRLGGITPQEVTALGQPSDPAKSGEAAMGMLGKLLLVKASIGFEDHSIVERAIKAYAKTKKISPEDALKEVLKQLADSKASAPDDFSKELVDAAIKFLQNPGEIEIVAEPPQPVPLFATIMGGMAAPGELKKALGLKVTVK